MTELFSVEDLLNHAGLEPGMVVLEVHPSRSGMMTHALGSRVGSRGQVYAVDPRHEVVSWLEGVRRSWSMPQVRVLKGDPEVKQGLNLADESVDRIILLNSLWLVRNVSTYIEELRRSLRPRGEIMVVEWLPQVVSPYAPPLEYRVAEEDACAAFDLGQCYACGRVPVSDSHWGWRFIKD